jgi:Asp-tRNA(Asn)/Glu-tRNA(Gln) amidotransferase A subunit family amidase
MMVFDMMVSEEGGGVHPQLTTRTLVPAPSSAHHRVYQYPAWIWTIAHQIRRQVDIVIKLSVLWLDNAYYWELSVFRPGKTQFVFSRFSPRLIICDLMTMNSRVENNFLQALKIRHLLVEEMNSVMNQVDLLLTLTTPSVAPLLEEVKSRGTIEGYMEDSFTVFASLVGAPALSLPVRYVTGEQLPYSIQLITRRADDNLLLDYARGLKQFL